jgi:hypothetical protein
VVICIKEGGLPTSIVTKTTINECTKEYWEKRKFALILSKVLVSKINRIFRIMRNI